MDINLLKKSCSRLPRLIELKSPACIVVGEMQLLNDLAYEALQDLLRQEFRGAQNKRRQKKSLKAEAKDASDGSMA